MKATLLGRFAVMQLIKDWFTRAFSDPQIMVLIVLLVAGFSVVMLTGNVLAPVFASAVLAYLLEGAVVKMERRGVPRVAAATLMYVLFIIMLTGIIFGLVPLLYRQALQMIGEIPRVLSTGQELLMALPEKYPTLVTVEQVNQFIKSLGGEVNQITQSILGRTFQVGVGLTYGMVVLVLVPFLVFFMLKDKNKMKAWFENFLPDDYRLTANVLNEVDSQLGNYVRGKAIEIMVVGSVSYVYFLVLGLNYSLLLAALVGVSVIVPYVGATVVTIPILAVGLLQWGLNDSFAWLFFGYGIIQMLDGNALVPLLFSEVVNLHPVAIIVAVLFFGGIWGFWGVFFAIPLATLVNAVLNAWPMAKQHAS